jgi:hypothetical protein
MGRPRVLAARRSAPRTAAAATALEAFIKVLRERELMVWFSSEM